MEVHFKDYKLCGEAAPAEIDPTKPIVGKEKSKKSAEHPKSFCREYGKLAARHFMRIARSEFLEARTELVQGSLGKLQAKKARLEEETKAAEDRTKEIQESVEYRKATETSSSSSTSGLVWKEGERGNSG